MNAHKIFIKGGEQTGEYQIYMNGVKEKQANVDVTTNGKKITTGDLRHIFSMNLVL